MEKIKKLSITLKYIFYILLVVYPMVAIAFWIWPQIALKFGIPYGIISHTEILHVITSKEKLLGFSIQLVPNIMMLLIFYCLAKLFAYYEKGEVFVVASTTYLKRVGYLLLGHELLTTFITDPFTQVVLTIHNPPHHRYASITFGSYDLYTIVAALMFMLIAWIMAEACKLQYEQSLTI